MARAKNMELRQKLLQCALKMFLEKGYENILMKEIAAECDISLSLLQYYFKKKEDILVHIFYDMLIKDAEYIDENLLNAIEQSDADKDAVYLGVFYRLFYGVLGISNHQLLKMYTPILYDTQLLKRVSDYMFEHDARTNQKLNTYRKRMGGYVLNGCLAQFVAIYLSDPLSTSLEKIVDDALRVCYGYLNVSSEEQERTIGSVNTVLTQQNIQQFYEAYMNGAARFISCEW